MTSTTFFFLLMRPPPLSTLFPYTTLFRSADVVDVLMGEDDRARLLHRRLDAIEGGGVGLAARSEEHTSELQSRFDLVCRLLLENKKKLRIILPKIAAASSAYRRSTVMPTT